MLARIDPFERALRVFDSDRERLWHRPFWGFRWRTPEVFTTGFGALDVEEDDEGLTFKADLPGMDPKDVSVEAKDGVLTIQGERTAEKEEENKIYHRYERTYGSFCRSFNLTKNVDAEKIEAKYKDGVLTVRVPKVEEAKPRKIEVEAS